MVILAVFALLALLSIISIVTSVEEPGSYDPRDNLLSRATLARR